MTLADPAVADGFDAVVRGAPLVHCLTNIVVAGFTANVLLAIGASPAMVENAEESADFAAVAGAVLVNLGTMSAERERAMRAAAAAADASGTPWVLDPVGVGALAYRTAVAKELLSIHPSIVRGNASEVMSLAGMSGAAGKGVDSVASSDDALDAARSLARSAGCVVAVSGASDYVTNGTEVVAVPGGHPLMTRVTGVGCALGAVMAACCAVDLLPLAAAVTASAVLAAAGERASVGDPGPGTFAVGLLDALAQLATGVR
ncbi:MAG: hydroxyethylthiazole kinase, partial [Acidimicrobiales bacterium]